MVAIAILQLPIDIFLEIKSHLCPVSQASLALSCKALYLTFESALRSKEFNLPPRIYNKETARFEVEYERSLRWYLLFQIEDDRWQSCTKCVRLHPASEFDGPHGNKLRGTCVFGDKSGIVEICPCIQLTFRDKLKLVDELQASDEKREPARPPFWHECCIERESVYLTLPSGSVKFPARVRMMSRFQPILHSDGNLFIHAQYNIEAIKLRGPLEPPVQPLKDIPIFASPFSTVLDNILRFRGSDAIPMKSKAYRCRFSSTRFSDYKCSTSGENGNKFNYTFQTARNLGKGRELADDIWEDQCFFF